MSTVFADTHYFVALFNPRDQDHAKATAFTQSFGGRMVTTDWVIVELADAFAQQPNRDKFVAIFQSLRALRELSIVPADRELLLAGFDLYAKRADKNWSLTDCISFVVMERQQIARALTGDHHFEQAGFEVLLK
jgi:predicted nucleic acid-binding protein